MNQAVTPDPDDPLTGSSRLVLLALASVLILFPPETRGESMAGSALLILMVVLLGVRRPSSNWTACWVLFGGCLLFPQLLLSQAPGSVFEPWAMWILAVALGLSAAATRGDGSRARHALPLFVAAAASLAALYGLYQVMWGFERLASGIESGLPVAEAERVITRARSGRAFGALPTPAALGGLLILTIPLTVGAAMERDRGSRPWLIVAAVVQGAGLVATFSVTAIAGLTTALAVWSSAARRCREHGDAARRSTTSGAT